jgi:hypothetical protein
MACEIRNLTLRRCARCAFEREEVAVGEEEVREELATSRNGDPLAE